MTKLPDELAAERRHLAHARACLSRMRARAGVLGDVGVDAFASESLGIALRRRLAQLQDDPATALFFGRLDQRDGGEVFHVGRRHVRDDAADPVVIDWRAPLSRPFYRASTADPMGVARRRRFGFSAGELTSFEDEWLDAEHPPAAAISAILLEEIERPRVGPMRDIVATIQPDQDDLVRADLDETICVQGAPGTGKTAVGLHRAAYLLYTYPERLKRGGVLVIGPNRAFLSYVSNVLPALGEVDVEQLTIDELPGSVTVRGRDQAAAALVKADARMASVIRRAVYAGLQRAVEPVVVTVGARRYRVPPERLRRWVDDLRRGDLRYGAARDRLQTLVAHHIRSQLEARGGAPTDAAVERISRSPEVLRAVEAVWPRIDPVRLVMRVLGDGEFLAAAARGLLDEGEQAAIRWPAPARGPGSARWSVADAFLVDEAVGLVERSPSYGHVIVDEAQDLSPMQCRAVARRSATGSLTVLGDVAQGTAPWATDDWPATLDHLGKAAARVEPLTRGYRVPAEVVAMTNRLLPLIAAGVAPAESIRAGRGALRVVPVHGSVAGAVDEVHRALESEGSVGLIAADGAVPALRRALTVAGIAAALVGEEVDERVSVVPASLAKGLEFDSVVVVEPADIVAAEPRGLRRLYVVLTRAVSRLSVVHSKPLPEALT
ncbi:MAG: AAA family ATPase [Actinomycetota bacterium]|nr:AAA family ATPase [Actinomycetota bacterium]